MRKRLFLKTPNSTVKEEEQDLKPVTLVTGFKKY